MKQFELDLETRPSAARQPAQWKYSLTNNALVEDLGDLRHVYGFWERLFGHWVVDNKTGLSKEVLPTWIPLNADGIWRDPLLARTTELGTDVPAVSRKWRYESRAAFAAYFSGIPSRVRGLVASCGEHQWLALDLIAQVPVFAHFLDEQFYNEHFQYVYACLALSDAGTWSRLERRRFAESLMHSRRTDVLSHFAGVPCGRKTVRVLNKIAGGMCHKQAYQAIIKCMSDDDTAKALLHADTLDPYPVGSLNEIAPELLVPNVLRVIFTDFSDLEDLSDDVGDEPFDAFMRLNALYSKMPKDFRGRLDMALREATTLKKFLAWSRRWAKKAEEACNFPAPPIGTVGTLVPLASADAMRREGQEMESCVGSLVSDVLKGLKYYYHWSGPEEVTLELNRQAGIGWTLGDAFAKDNEEISPKTRQGLSQFLAEKLQGNENFYGKDAFGSGLKPASHAGGHP